MVMRTCKVINQIQLKDRLTVPDLDLALSYKAGGPS